MLIIDEYGALSSIIYNDGSAKKYTAFMARAGKLYLIRIVIDLTAMAAL